MFALVQARDGDHLDVDFGSEAEMRAISLVFST